MMTVAITRGSNLFRMVILSYCCLVGARVLTAYEQAVGQWDVTLKSNGWKKSEIPSMLFPPLKPSEVSSAVVNDVDMNKPTHCQLFIFPNGTFVMDAPVSSSERLPLRGQWKLQPNPYCITDRQYDQLVLESYPRVQKRASDEQVLQRVDINLQCRVCGRYGSNPMKRFMGYKTGRSSSRMTHGTLLWNVKQSQENNMPRWKSRRVCASFTAKPIESSSFEEEFDEVDYDNDDEI
jgi:hypothetical protein